MISQGIVGTAEGKLVPRDVCHVEPGRLERLVVRAQLTIHDRRRIDDDDRHDARIGIQVDQPVEADLEVRFLFGFAERGDGWWLAPVDIATRKDPLAVSGSIERRTSAIRPASFLMMVPTATLGSRYTT